LTTLTNAIFVRALNGELTELFKSNSFAAIGWIYNPIPDFSWETIENQIKIDHPEGSPIKIGVNTGQVYRFLNEIKIGTIVITPYRDGSLLIGLAKSEPYFQKDNKCQFFLRINVDWFEEKFDRRLLSIPTQNSIRSSLTIFRVNPVYEIAGLANIPLPETIKNEVHQIQIQEHNYIEAIRKQLLKLDATEFEILVSYIMQSLGFESNQSQGRTGDKGTDVEGTLDVFGFASIKLQIQVKRYESSVISEPEIRNFRGSLRRDHQGTFITLSKFNKKAVESAKDSNFQPINLIDGEQLIKVFIEQFDKVNQLIEDSEVHKPLLEKLKFRKIIIPQ
jgi:restriction system protein